MKKIILFIVLCAVTSSWSSTNYKTPTKLAPKTIENTQTPKEEPILIPSYPKVEPELGKEYNIGTMAGWLSRNLPLIEENNRREAGFRSTKIVYDAQNPMFRSWDDNLDGYKTLQEKYKVGNKADKARFQSIFPNAHLDCYSGYSGTTHLDSSADTSDARAFQAGLRLEKYSRVYQYHCEEIKSNQKLILSLLFFATNNTSYSITLEKSYDGVLDIAKEYQELKKEGIFKKWKKTFSEMTPAWNEYMRQDMESNSKLLDVLLSQPFPSSPLQDRGSSDLPPSPTHYRGTFNYCDALFFPEPAPYSREIQEARIGDLQEPRAFLAQLKGKCQSVKIPINGILSEYFSVAQKDNKLLIYYTLCYSIDHIYYFDD